VKRSSRAERLAVIVSVFSSGLKVEEEDIVSIVGKNRLEEGKSLVENISFLLVDKEEKSLRCKLCGKSFSTKRGFYFHLTRAHIREIVEMLDRRIKEEKKKRNKRGKNKKQLT